MALDFRTLRHFVAVAEELQDQAVVGAIMYGQLEDAPVRPSSSVSRSSSPGWNAGR
jgi:hypothetical protein